MGTFLPVSTYCRVFSLYINVSDIGMIKMIVNVNNALAPVLPCFERKTFLEPKCKWVWDHFSKTLWKPGKDKVGEKGSQRCTSHGIRDVHVYLRAGLISLLWAGLTRQSFNAEQKCSQDVLSPTSSHIHARVKKALHVNRAHSKTSQPWHFVFFCKTPFLYHTARLACSHVKQSYQNNN